MKRWQVLLLGAALVAAYGWIGSMDRQDAEREREQYCDMVQLWHDTNGDAGWPPYNGECSDD